MAFDNPAFTSWLSKNGKTHRTLILKKLKEDLRDRGMTPRQIYKGLLQLAGGPSVLIARCRNRKNVHLQPSVISCVPSHNKSSPTRETQSHAGYVRKDKISVDEKIVVSDSDEEESLRKRITKPITPELSDENIDNGSSLILTVPRKAIPLNLKSDRAQSAKNHLPPARPPPEIRVADSSVSDSESTSRSLAETCNSREESTISDEDRGVKRPKIIADVTCIEGTIIPGLCLLKRPRILQNSKKDCDNFVDIAEDLHNIHNSPGTCYKDSEKIRKSSLDEEREGQKISGKKNPTIYEKEEFTTKKFQLRRKCRQLFGSDLTLSELNEEDEIIERFVRKKQRKKHSRISQDSGVGLSDWASSDRVTIPKEVDCPNGSEGNEELNKSASLHDVSSNEKGEDLADMTLRSMPSLDASYEVISTEEFTEDLPDSSTNTEEKSVITEVTTADSSNDGKVSSNEKMKILVSPAYPESSDRFTPVTLELELSSGTQMPVPTSTTESLPVAKIGETIDNQDRANNVDIGMQNDSSSINVQETTISTREEEKTANSSIEDVTKLPIISDPQPVSTRITNVEATSLTTDSDQCQKEVVSHDPVVDSLRQEQAEPLNLCSRRREIDPKDETTKINEDSEITIESTLRVNNTDNIVNNENSIGSQPVPKFRVLHHRELGSRWCPTPLNNDSNFNNIEKPKNSQRIMFPMHNLPQVRLNQNQQPTPVESLTLLTMKMPISTKNAGNIRKDVITSYQNLNTNVHFPYERRENFVNSLGSVSTSSVLPTAIFNDSTRQEEGLIFNILFKHLLPLNSFVVKSTLSYGSRDAVTLQRLYTLQRELLWLKLGKFSSYIRNHDINYVVNRIMDYYDILMPPEKRILTAVRFMDILKNEILPAGQHPVAPGDSSPLQLPVCCARTYLPQNSIPPYIPQRFVPQRDIQSNFERLRLEKYQPVKSVFTEVQQRIFSHQVMMYNHLTQSLSYQLAENAVREKGKRRSRRKVVTEGNTMRNVVCDETRRAVAPIDAAILRIQKEPLQAASVEETTLREHRKTGRAGTSVEQTSLQETLRNITTMNQPILKIHLESSKNSAMVNQLENIRSGTENCVNSNENIVAATSVNDSTVDITDVLQELDALSSSPNDINSINERKKSSSNSSCHESSSIPGGSSGCRGTMKTICSSSIGIKIGNDKTEDIPASENTRMHTSNDYNVTTTNDNEERSTNEEIDNRENIEPSSVDFIVLDDSHSGDNLHSSEAAVIEEMNFISILEVKSISKDVFNNINGDNVETPQLQPSMLEQKEEDSAAPMYEWSDCFRCGKPSSVVCERCYLAFYCSIECHEAHWTENHHTNCKPLPVETLAQLNSSFV